MDHDITEVSAKLLLKKYIMPEKVIVNSARVSFKATFEDCDTEMSEKDIRLLKRLFNDEHMSPFEQVDATFGIHCPISIARQFHRHRTFSYNEQSARYRKIDNIQYQDMAILRKQCSINKQSSIDDDTFVNFDLTCKIRDLYLRSEVIYNELLTLGVSREQARFTLLQGTFTYFIAKGNLRNWLHFLKLRIAPDAQLEIRILAKQIARQLKEVFPITMNLFIEKYGVDLAIL